jgi:predicted alpha/beta superfamily hydrolase
MSLTLSPRPFLVRNHDQFEVRADGLGRYTIDVSLPPDHETGSARYPVVLTTDGNILFDLVQVVVHGRFTRMSPVLPPSILVGVGYPDDEGMASWYARRNHDFFEAWAMTDPLGQLLHGYFDLMKQAEAKPELRMGAGGYPRFMAFLRDELLPGLAERYPIDREGRHTLVGHSSGGQFALRALFDPASPFRRYVCISPSLGAADGSVQRAEADYAAAHRDLDADVFVCCGQGEIGRDAAGSLCRFGSGALWVVEQFGVRQWPSARLDWEVMNLEDHTSIPARALSAGLRSVHRRRPGIHDDEIQQAQAARMGEFRDRIRG